MKVVGKFNLLPDALAEEVSKKSLKPGERVIYELLRYELDGKTGERLYGSVVELPGRDTIIHQGQMIDIGIVQSYEGDKVLNCKGFILGGNGGKVGSRFELSGDNQEHVILHWFFSLCNFNESNPNASKSTIKLIKEVNLAAEARQNTKKRSLLREALAAAEDMKPEAIRLFAAAKGWDAAENLDILRDLLSANAQSDPAGFLALATDETVKIKAEIGMASTMGYLFHDQATNSVKNKDGVMLAQLEFVENKPWLEVFYDTLKVMKDGAKIKGEIRSWVKAEVAKNLSLRNAAGEENDKD